MADLGVLVLALDLRPEDERDLGLEADLDWDPRDRDLRDVDLDLRDLDLRGVNLVLEADLDEEPDLDPGLDLDRVRDLDGQDDPPSP